MKNFGSKLRSIIAVPLWIPPCSNPDRMLFLPSEIFSSAFGVDIIEKTFSALDAINAGELHHIAPCEINELAFCLVRLKTTGRYPALSRRVATGAVIDPRPTKPIFSFLFPCC